MQQIRDAPVKLLIMLPPDESHIPPPDALPWLKQGAERGMNEAMHEVGRRYRAGIGVSTNSEEALHWYSRALQNGYTAVLPEILDLLSLDATLPTNTALDITVLTNAAAYADGDAKCQLAGCFADGKGIRQDTDAAIYWYERAAQCNNSNAMYALGLHYAKQSNGQAKAAAWLEQAAETGHLEAQYQLGKLLIQSALPTQQTQAVQWLLKAAHAQHADAQYLLGLCCYKGVGTPQDNASAKEWLQKAAQQNHPTARAVLERIVKAESGGK